jgi:hypothetical protein
MDQRGDNIVIHAKIAFEMETEPRRREARCEVTAEIPLRQLGQNTVDARLVNISSHGFMVETGALIEAGARVWLTLPGAGRVNGLVIWSRNGCIGGTFAEPIDPLAVLQAMGESTLL